MCVSYFYVADPMCSWCWGFADVLSAAENLIPDDAELTYVMGGLAPDTAEPMPEETKDYIRKHWEAVAAATGAKFNWDFWEIVTPRRSTYPACRAVIAARLQGKRHAPQMFRAIQTAYYLQARNPSDDSTLVEIASEIGLETQRFSSDLNSAKVEAALQADFQTRRELGANQFPSLLVRRGKELHWVCRGYAPEGTVVATLSSIG